jgi:hypothetical protein
VGSLETIVEIDWHLRANSDSGVRGSLLLPTAYCLLPTLFLLFEGGLAEVGFDAADLIAKVGGLFVFL